MDKLITSIHNLLSYIESESYKGYDPYDALKSPLLNLPIFGHNKTFRFGFQQLLKRSPVNLRPLFIISKGYNPVTLGLCIQAYTYLIDVFPSQKKQFENKIDFLITELKKLIPKGFHGACWGYDFPWQARYAEIQAFQPTVVATGIITNALYISYKRTGNAEALNLCESASDFVLHDLHRTYDNGSFCFSYSPFDTQEVYNASAKGLRLLAQVYAETGDESLKTIAAEAVTYISNRQQPDGSWHYSKAGKWIDNYHTGYVLDCLDEYYQLTGDTTIKMQLVKGFEFYQSNFFTPEGIPKLKVSKKHPVDCTAAGQSLLTLGKFDNTKMATLVAHWMIDHMQSPAGYFYYRKGTCLTSKVSFMRWSNAWMLAGLSFLVAKLNN
jgi:rhamnogalacturonyl hydrolase YesR